MKPMTVRKIVLYSILLTLLIEGVTAFFRFGFAMEASRVFKSTEGRLTGGVRIHHGYVGAVLLLAGMACWRKGSRGSRPQEGGAAGSRTVSGPVAWLVVIGVALLASDLIHHFLILWPIVGSPQFDLFYPP